MTKTEAIAMMWRAHLLSTVQCIETIEALRTTDAQKELEIRSLITEAATEFATYGYDTAIKFLKDNRQSKLDFSQEVGAIIKPPAVSINGHAARPIAKKATL